MESLSYAPSGTHTVKVHSQKKKKSILCHWSPSITFSGHISPGLFSQRTNLRLLCGSRRLPPSEALSQIALFWCVHFLTKSSSRYSHFFTQSKRQKERKVAITIQKLRKPRMEPLSLWKKQCWRENGHKGRIWAISRCCTEPLSCNLHSDLSRWFPFPATRSLSTISHRRKSQ